jgi:TRAP-type mannitol/chloroaromatic compound transport system permease small subunit
LRRTSGANRENKEAEGNVEGMPDWIKIYVRWVEAVNRKVGWFSMYVVFGSMFGVLLYSSISRVAFNVPPAWGIELAQFLMVAYYLLAGGYTLADDSHVRMDVFYSRWSLRGRALADLLTAVFLLTYLFLLLYGGVSSTIYSIVYAQKNYSAWAPYLWPIKTVMVIGIVLTILQAIACFIRDLATLRRERI